MGDIIPLNQLSTAQEVVDGLTKEELEASENIVIIRLDKDAKVFVSYNRMSPERMYYLAGVLDRYALSI